MKSCIWLGLTLGLLAGHAWAATNSVVFIPGVQSGPCSSWPTCPAVPNDATHPFYFAPSTGATFAVTGNVTITPSGTQTVTGSVSVSGSALPSNAAQETGGNLAAVAGSTASTATATGTTATNTTAISTGTGTPADAAYSGSGSSSIIAALKGLYAKLAGTLTVSGTVTTGSASTDGSTTQTTGGTAQALFGGATPSNGWKVSIPVAIVSITTFACYASDATTTPSATTAGSQMVYAGGQYSTEPGQKPVGPVYINCPSTGQAISAQRW